MAGILGGSCDEAGRYLNRIVPPAALFKNDGLADRPAVQV
jgi:hypothetical protein